IIPAVKERSLFNQLVKHFMHFLIDLFVEIGEMRAAVVIARIGKKKYFPLGNDPVETMPVTVLHFFHAKTSPRMSFHQLSQSRPAIACDLQEFFMNKSADHTFLFIWHAVIKYAYFNGQINQVLYDIFNRYSLVIFF